MDRGALRATVHGIAESNTTERLTLSLLTFLPAFVLLCPNSHFGLPCAGLLFWYPIAAKDFVRYAFVLHIQILGVPTLHRCSRTCMPLQEMEETPVQSLGREAPLE